jgi:hypothetical protein
MELLEILGEDWCAPPPPAIFVDPLAPGGVTPGNYPMNKSNYLTILIFKTDHQRNHSKASRKPYLLLIKVNLFNYYLVCPINISVHY